jgi:hypothetical protein
VLYDADLSQTRRSKMTLSNYGASDSAKWKDFDDMLISVKSPAGSLFISGLYAEADIVGKTGTGSGKCGTGCSGSFRKYCC